MGKELEQALVVLANVTTELARNVNNLVLDTQRLVQKKLNAE